MTVLELINILESFEDNSTVQVYTGCGTDKAFYAIKADRISEASHEGDPITYVEISL